MSLLSVVENVIRADVRKLSAYPVPNAQGFVKLDAMENPYTLPVELQQALAKRISEVALNRYPVPHYRELKNKIQQKLGVPVGFDVVLGNGSDELISMVSIACAKAGAKVLAPLPGFVMYAISAQFAGMEFIGVPLRADLTLDKAQMLSAIAEHQPAITYLAYPNNPTGNLFDEAEIVEIIKAVGNTGIVIIDEAYQPFAQTSFMPRLPEFDNVVVMRTVSKLGLAGVRLGYMSASTTLLNEFEKVRPPYNINVLTEAAVDCLLDHIDVFNEQAAKLREQRTFLSQELSKMPEVEVFPSAANFILIRVNRVKDLENKDAETQYGDHVFSKLLEQKILVKNVGKMHVLLKNCLRITVSTPEENMLLLNALTHSL